MNKHNIPFLANAIVDAAIRKIAERNQGIAASPEWLRNLLLSELWLNEPWEDFDEIVDNLVEAWEMDQEDEEDDPGTALEKQIDALQVGHNIIPGLGIAYAADEKDLESLKNYLKNYFGAFIMLHKIFGR